MTDDPIDLSPLDPTHDPTEFNQIVDRVRFSAAAELSRRRARGSMWWQLSAWRWPALASAAAVLAIAIGASQFGPEEVDPVSESYAVDEIDSALGVPDAMSGWMAVDSLPSPADVLFPGANQ